jgi:hypothetical protein
MAQVKIEDVVYHLDGEFKKALSDTMAKFAPRSAHDPNVLFKFFLSRVYHHCSVWEKVPDSSLKFDGGFSSRFRTAPDVGGQEGHRLLVSCGNVT